MVDETNQMRRTYMKEEATFLTVKNKSSQQEFKNNLSES